MNAYDFSWWPREGLFALPLALPELLKRQKAQEGEEGEKQAFTLLGNDAEFP